MQFRKAVVRLILIASVLTCAWSGFPVRAQDSASSTAPDVRLAALPGNMDKVRSARKALIVFTGADLLRARVMEDALGAELMTAGIEVVSRSRVETLVAGKQMSAAQVSTEKVGTGQRSEPATAAAEPLGATDVAKAAGAQIVMIGTMLDERQRSALVGTGRPGQLLEQPIVTVSASIQVVDVSTDIVLAMVIGQWPDGEAITKVATALGDRILHASR